MWFWLSDMGIYISAIHQLQYKWMQGTTVSQLCCLITLVASSLSYLTASFLIWHGMLVFIFMYASVVCHGLWPFSILFCWKLSPPMFSCRGKQEVTYLTPDFLPVMKIHKAKKGKHSKHRSSIFLAVMKCMFIWKVLWCFSATVFTSVVSWEICTHDSDLTKVPQFVIIDLFISIESVAKSFPRSI